MLKIAVLLGLPSATDQFCIRVSPVAQKATLDPARLNPILTEISCGEEESIRKLRRLDRESERNKRCFASSNASSVLMAVFAEHSAGALCNGLQKSVEICEEALAALTLTLALTSQVMDFLALSDAIACLVWILREGNLEAKNNTVVILRAMVSNDKYRDMVAKSEGLAEGLVQLLREPICPVTTKLSVGIIYHISLRKTVRIKLVEAGVVPLLVEILVNGERGICEKAMLPLEILCCCTEGQEATSANALTLLVVVKKMLRISNLEKERVNALNILVSTPGRLLQHMDETPLLTVHSSRLEFQSSLETLYDNFANDKGRTKILDLQVIMSL